MSSPSTLIGAADLDLPLTARGSKAAEANASAAKKQRVSIKANDEEKGVDLESDAAVCIRSTLMQLCNELGEQALAGVQFPCPTVWYKSRNTDAAGRDNAQAAEKEARDTDEEAAGGS
jgi:hypothetical protein